MVTFTPVDHDPFAAPSQAQEGGLRLTPVDHDPFAPTIDFNRPVEDVRADIAKLPEGKQRDQAMQKWADDYVAREREKVKAWDVPGAINPKRLDDTIRNFARGTIVGSFADEANAATNAALYNITGGRFGAPYDESVAYQRALDRALKTEAPVLSTATELAGGLASGGPVAKAVISGGKTMAGKIARGGAVGGTYTYGSGLGTGEGDIEQRNAYALERLPVGIALGAAIPPAIAGAGAAGSKLIEALSPTFARIGANLSELPRRIGFPASADGAGPEGVGAMAAAEQVIANQLMRGGRTVADLRSALNAGSEAGRFHSSGRAQDATALVDLDPSLQRLAGSAARASPEAGTTASNFIAGRQTGITPSRPLPPEAGIPTRPMMSQPLTGAQAQRALGSRFGTPDEKVVPMGQGDRIQDALKRAFLLEDEKWHGHGANALRTDQDLLRLAKEEAQSLYGETYNAGGNIDVSPAIAPVFRAWADRITQEPQPVAAAIQRMMRLFFTRDGAMVTNIERFDKAKQFADGMIEKFFQSAEGRNRYLGGVLTELKNDLLKGVRDANGKVVGGVDNITTSGLGEKYAKARGAFGDRAEARNALQMGRDAFKADSDIGVDAFRSLTTEGQQKLFRLGLLSGYEKAAAGMKRGADKTQLFDNPRIQELLSEVIPRTETAGGRARGVFGDRPERFGRYVGNEKRMVETRNEVVGNSKTAQRQADDEAFEGMTKLGAAIDKFKNSGSALNIGIKAAETIITKLFGMRADTAASIARQLFAADPAVRARVLSNIETRMGRGKLEELLQALEAQQQRVTTTGATQAGRTDRGL